MMKLIRRAVALAVLLVVAAAIIGLRLQDARRSAEPVPAPAAPSPTVSPSAPVSALSSPSPEISEESLPEPEPVVTPPPDPLVPVFMNAGKTVDGILPAGWYEDCPEPGTLELDSYHANDYATGYDITKTAYVYLPYGYSEEKAYNVIILCHGSGGDETFWFSPFSDANGVKVKNDRLLDHMIYEGLIPPVIAVSVTWANEVTCVPSDRGIGQLNRDSLQLGRELYWDILPWIAESFSTYAESSETEALSAARDHFAYLGLSWGAMTGLTGVMKDNVSCIANFGFLAPSGVDLSATCESVNSQSAEYPLRGIYVSAGSNDVGSLGKTKEIYSRLCSDCPGITDEETAFFREIAGGAHEMGTWAAGLYNSLILFYSG